MYEKAALAAPDYAGDPHFVIFLCLVVVFNVLVLLETAFLLGMGNEGSQLSSEGSTPLSEYQSMYSYSVGPRTRSSAPSTRAPSPVEPPEPDLSHLTPEEIAKIKEVMDRARNMQTDDQRRARQLEEEYIEYATKMEREASLSELSDCSTSLCPVCNKVDVVASDDVSKSGPYVCADCGKVTCSTCGVFDNSLTSNAKEWVCIVCQRRRKLIMSTGLWYHGSHPESELPLERELNGEPYQTDENEKGRDHFQLMPPTTDVLSAESRGETRHANTGLPETAESQSNGPKMDWSFDSSQPTSSQSSFEMIPHKPSKLKGTGGVSTLSDPEDFSDFTFEDYDVGDFGSKPVPPPTLPPPPPPNQEKVPSEEQSPGADAPEEGEGGHKLRRKHRPRSLNLTRSHSLTSPEDDSDGGQSAESSGPAAAPAKSPEHLSPEELLSQTVDEPSLSESKSHSEVHALGPPDMTNKTMNSPTPPRSPSWREGLESPPFSPKRKDSYPGKPRRGSPVSPKDKRLHFTYTDISPPSRQLSLDELYGDGQCSSKDNSFFGMHMAQKPSPVSPEEVRNTLLSSLGEPLQFEMPTRDKLQTFSAPCVQNLGSSEDVSMDSAPVMDVATYAATIASSTASLTSMSVSPTNLSVSSSYDSEQVSPESMGSTDSSPVSPGYYDNSTPEDMEDVELADPSTKSIDYQGSKRQKARPPTTDWSPVIDLSPILDVSPSVEEAEQEDMLAKQLEEFERQQSLTEGLDVDDDNGESGEVSDKSDKSSKDSNEEESFQGLKRYDIMEDISRIDGSGLHEVKVMEYNGSQKNMDAENGNVLFESEDDGDSLLLICTSVAQPPLPTSSSPYYSTSMGQPPRYASASRSSMITSLQTESDTNTEFRKINNDLQDILKSGAVDVKPIPPPKPRRKLPDPSSDMLDTHYSETERTLPSISAKAQEADSIDEAAKLLDSSKHPVAATHILPRQDSGEKRKAKDLKAKPNPLLIQHIETEEQSVSPHYKILDSPPTPEQKAVRREFSESTSVSPSSSPDRDMYMFPSPVTPPDSDSSPPKPQSPSSPGTDEDVVGRMPVRTLSFGSNLNGIADDVKPIEVSEEISESRASVRDKIKAFEMDNLFKDIGYLF
ncbi:protein piccolo-like [Gigantopelta aegis]|uniref:protein piccolo-like n=1 Tax=Gigantopelta aegis TaxID=1735272 RepID=UPI001B888D3A|nr:protein piccolo-like [Gigantopelta aegis]